MKRDENIFLLAVCIGTVVFEIANINGLGLCLFLPVTLSVLYVGLKVFPDRSKNTNEQE